VLNETALRFPEPGLFSDRGDQADAEIFFGMRNDNVTTLVGMLEDVV